MWQIATCGRNTTILPFNLRLEVISDPIKHVN